MTRLFGTDGIRGPFGVPPLDRETVTALGSHLALALRESGLAAPRVVLAGDTRSSSPTLCRWLAAGLEAGGAGFVYGGTLPTPAVAYLTLELGADAGIAVSASHNPPADNGIKIFDRQGFKWSSEGEAMLEEHLRQVPGPDEDAHDVELVPEPELGSRYLAHLNGLVDDGALSGQRIAVDSANGAASGFAARLFAALGAEVVSLFDRPNGENINQECGSTRPEAVARAVLDRGCDLGVAFDGDADRAVLVDETGTLRDGDAILYLWASGLKRRGRLEPERIVATTMSNLGLERALAREGIGLERCDVGDREVVDKLRSSGVRLGGEQSGHIVHLDLSTTGDGLVTATQAAAMIRQLGTSASAALAGFRRYPQVLVNVPVTGKPDFSTLPSVVTAARSVEAKLGERGRLLLRYSGTEPLARVMLEGPEQSEIDELAGAIAEAIRREIGLEEARR